MTQNCVSEGGGYYTELCLKVVSPQDLTLVPADPFLWESAEGNICVGSLLLAANIQPSLRISCLNTFAVIMRLSRPSWKLVGIVERDLGIHILVTLKFLWFI
jgi:hypothetical protein